MLHCHVASVPAYTHFLTIFSYTTDQNVSFMYMAFQSRDIPLPLFPHVYYWAYSVQRPS
jgi:hypothetical protein